MFSIQFRRDLSTEWARFNPILLAGEAGYEIDTKRFRIGDGVTRWLSLPHYANDDEILTVESLQRHIDSQTPHPVYDDAPSIILTYQNAKV